MKNIKAWLKRKSACKKGIEWFSKQKETDPVKLLRLLIKDNELSWANWSIARLLSRKGKLQYAIYAAEQVLPLYEEKYPTNMTPRKAIQAAKICLKHDTEKNRSAAKSAAWTAAKSAAAAVWAVEAAVWAAEAAAVWAAVWAAEAAAAAAAAAAAEAAWSADAAAAWSAMKTKIIRYGIKLYKKECAK